MFYGSVAIVIQARAASNRNKAPGDPLKRSDIASDDYNALTAGVSAGGTAGAAVTGCAGLGCGAVISGTGGIASTRRQPSNSPSSSRAWAGTPLALTGV